MFSSYAINNFCSLNLVVYDLKFTDYESLDTTRFSTHNLKPFLSSPANKQLLDAENKTLPVLDRCAQIL